jgi:hypothetical protein
MAQAHPRSIAGAIKTENWDEVVEAVCRIIDTSYVDQEASLIVSTARVKEKLPHAFSRHRANKGGFSSWGTI